MHDDRSGLPSREAILRLATGHNSHLKGHEATVATLQYAESQKVGLQFGNVRQGPRKRLSDTSLSDVILDLLIPCLL